MRIFAALALTLLLSGCVTPKTAFRIPDGVYRPPGSLESVEVRGGGLTFTLWVPKLDSQKVCTCGPYSYRGNEEGGIRLFASSNDSVFVFGVLNYNWSWDGKNIVRKHYQTKQAVLFAPEAETTK